MIARLVTWLVGVLDHIDEAFDVWGDDQTCGCITETLIWPDGTTREAISEPCETHRTEGEL